MNTIEEKLWNYIDGTCDAKEQQAIEQLIATDEVYRNKYNDLLQLNVELAITDIDEPPMAFTYNVMEAIRAEKAMQPLKARIDGRIIWGIAAFFIVTVAALLIYAFSTVNWSNATHVNSTIKINTTRFTGIFSGAAGKGFLFLDVVLGLFLIDHYLLRRGMTRTQ